MNEDQFSSGFFPDTPALSKKVKEKMLLKALLFLNVAFVMGASFMLDAQGSEVKGSSEAAASPSAAQTAGNFEFSTQPIGDLFGVFGAQVDRGIIENFSLGFSFDYFHTVTASGNRSTRAVQYGLVNIFYPWHRFFTTGPFVKAELDVLTNKTQRIGHFAGDSNTVEVFQVGYSWLLPKNVTVGWGVGISYYQGDGGPGVDPSYLLQLGWTGL